MGTEIRTFLAVLYRQWSLRIPCDVHPKRCRAYGFAFHIGRRSPRASLPTHRSQEIEAIFSLMVEASEVREGHGSILAFEEVRARSMFGHSRRRVPRNILPVPDYNFVLLSHIILITIIANTVRWSGERKRSVIQAIMIYASGAQSAILYMMLWLHPGNHHKR